MSCIIVIISDSGIAHLLPTSLCRTNPKTHIQLFRGSPFKTRETVIRETFAMGATFSLQEEEDGLGVGEVAIFRAIRLIVKSGIVIANVRMNWFTPPLPEQ
jgi:hypothetical protein